MLNTDAILLCFKYTFGWIEELEKDVLMPWCKVSIKIMGPIKTS